MATHIDRELAACPQLVQVETAWRELNRALAHSRRRQDPAPTPHSAREIAQLSMLAEYLYADHVTDELFIAERTMVEQHIAA